MVGGLKSIGRSVVIASAMAVGVVIHAVPGIARSSSIGDTRLAAASNDPAPQRLQMAQAVSPLPGGASALNETYKDWRVTCVQQGTTKRCALSQTQAQQNGQRLLVVELGAPAGNTVTGTLVLPFGLALDSGIGLQIDDKTAGQSLRVRTCLPGGCLVNLTFDAAMLVALRAGTALKIKAVADDGVAASFSIPLQGFGTALDRVGALSR